MKGVWIDFDELTQKKEEVVILDGKKYSISLRSVEDMANTSEIEEKQRLLRENLKETQKKYENVDFKYEKPFEPAVFLNEWDALK